jgi:hypothetical protein
MRGVSKARGEVRANRGIDPTVPVDAIVGAPAFTMTIAAKFVRGRLLWLDGVFFR